MLKSMLERLSEAHAAELEGEEAAEAGFTLIELMVVLLIIAILLAIAIPTFLGVTSAANDRAAQSNLTNALTEASSQYQNNSQSYSGIGAALSSNAPEFSWQPGGTACTTQTNCISYAGVDVAQTSDQQGLILATYSAPTSTCWYAVTLSANPANPGGASGFSAASGATTGGTFYAKSNKTSPGTGKTCSANTAQTGFKWSSSYATAPDN